jgi:hypothetical protein
VAIQTRETAAQRLTVISGVESQLVVLSKLGLRFASSLRVIRGGTSLLASRLLKSKLFGGNNNIAPHNRSNDMRDNVRTFLRYFEYKHLPDSLQLISKPFYDLAHMHANSLEGPELMVGLRKLLEAKDCMVRAGLP